VSALSPWPRGSVRSDHRRAQATYSSVGALRTGFLPPSGQLTGVIVVLADDVVERTLVVVAHPDDVDFWAGGTVACWTRAGIAVTYCVLSDGDSVGSILRFPARPSQGFDGPSRKRPQLS
jgi:hypothetical protein